MRIKSGKTVNCNVCGLQFYCSPKRLKSKTICCSIKCSSKLVGDRLRKRVEVECLVCKKIMLRKVSQKNRVKYPACSDVCKNEVRSLYRVKGENSNYLHRSELERFLHNRAMECNRRAFLANREASLTGDILFEAYNNQKGLCYYTKYPLTIECGRFANSLSVDRIDSTKGYSKENIVLCCLSVNIMKNDFNESEIIKIFESYANNRG